jgi:DNA-binding transcriptional ArsR family regulator
MDAMNVLSDGTRRQIIELLASGQRAAGDIASRFDVTAPAVSHHLKILRQARLVRVRGEGQRRIYCLDPEGFKPIFDWVDYLRSFWSAHLDQLETALRKSTDAVPRRATRTKRRKP